MSEGKRIGYRLLRPGEPLTVLEGLSKRYGVPAIQLDEFEIAPEWLRLIPRELAMRHRVIPVNRSGRVLMLATVDPADRAALEAVRQASGLDVDPLVTTAALLDRALTRFYPAVP